MPKIIQICPATGGGGDPTIGVVILYGLAADGSVWQLYSNSRGDCWYPLRASTYSSVAAQKQTASADR